MAFRVVLVENEIQMKVKLENLVVNKDGEDIWIPLDDISMIVVDNLASSLTMRTLTEFANHNIGLVVCNHEHLPIGFYSSYDNHSHISKNIGFQINKDSSFYDELWLKIIASKISNQAETLKKLGFDSPAINKLKELITELTPGDKTNREAHAAKIYFNTLMDNSFSRGNDEILLNSGLDYGYSIIRSFIARLCVAYGLNSQLGIHHKNEFNRFNLVDDLMEPIRPFVDYQAYILLTGEDYFKPEHRHALVNLLNHKINYKGQNMYVCNMLEDYVAQVAAYISERADQIVFPKIEDYIGEEEHEI